MTKAMTEWRIRYGACVHYTVLPLAESPCICPELAEAVASAEISVPTMLIVSSSESCGRLGTSSCVSDSDGF